MEEKGIIVACDQDQEWLLDWWWGHYSLFNSYPVAFIDFGLSEKGKKWCAAKGEVVFYPDIFEEKEKNPIPSKKKELWEQLYGKGIWNFRPKFLKKPKACRLSPFLQSIWIDLDCRVLGDVTPLFTLLQLDIEIALQKSPPDYQRMRQEMGLLQLGEYHFSSGVIAYHRDAPVIEKWVELARQSEEFPADEEALSRAIFLTSPRLLELPEIYNWSWKNPPNKDAVMVHYHGKGKLQLIEEIVPRKTSL